MQRLRHSCPFILINKNEECGRLRPFYTLSLHSLPTGEDFLKIIHFYYILLSFYY